MASVAEKSGWLSLSEAQQRLAVGRTAILALVAAGRISSRTVPGSRPMVLAADIEQIAIESTRYATPSSREVARMTSRVHDPLADTRPTDYRRVRLIDHRLRAQRERVVAIDRQATEELARLGDDIRARLGDGGSEKLRQSLFYRSIASCDPRSEQPACA